VPAATTGLNPANDSATDQDPIVPNGLFANGFEGVPGALTAPDAKAALDAD
jgi:hypothetical protein